MESLRLKELVSVIVQPVGVKVFVRNIYFLLEEDCYFDVFAGLERRAEEFWLRHVDVESGSF